MSYSDRILADNPLAYWKLNEASGAPQDSSGNGFHLTVTGAPTYGQGSFLGGGGTSILFDTGAYCSLTPVPAALQLATWTLEGWLYWPGSNTPTQGGSLITEQYAAGDGLVRYALGFDQPTARRQPFGGFYQGGSWKRYEWTLEPTQNAWHHYVATYDGTVVRLYIDAVERGTFNTTATPGGNEAIYIGRRWDSTASVRGRLAHLAIYSGARSPQTITEHYALGVGRAFTLDAYVETGATTVADDFTLDAGVRATRAGSATLNAVTKTSRAGGTPVDAVVLASRSTSFALNGVVRGAGAASATVDAVVLASQAGSATLAAVVEGEGVQAFSIDAIIQATRTQGFVLDAVVRVQRSGTLPLDAYVSVRSAAQATLDANVHSTRTGGFGLDAVVGTLATGSLALEAWVRVPGFGVRPLNAIVRATRGATWSLDAYVRVLTEPRYLDIGATLETIDYIGATDESTYLGATAVDFAYIGATRIRQYEGSFVMAAEVESV